MPNLFPYNENANDKIVSFEYKGIDTHDSFYSIRDFSVPCVTVTWKETGNVVNDFTLFVQNDQIDGEQSQYEN